MLMQVNMLEAKSQLSSLVAAAEQGEEVLIARNGVPVAKLVKYEAPNIKPPGAWKGKVTYSQIWNSPKTNAEVEALFAGDD
jgi:prevent-host-death family protein